MLSSSPKTVARAMFDDSKPGSLRDRLKICFSVASLIAK